MFLHTWMTHMQCELEAEKIRLMTQTKRGFSVHSAFYVLDANKDNSIDKEDVSFFVTLTFDYS
jgi:hypothetical protein